MDYKTRYSLGVELAKREAGIEAELQKKISAGHTRKEIYGENWQAVNINDVINRFTPGAEPIRESGKMVFVSNDGKYGIYADIGGGYLRVYDYITKQYVGLNGENMHNYVDSKEKQHGRSKADYNAVTHFRILKREEMSND